MKSVKIIILTLAFGSLCLAVDNLTKDVIITPMFGLCWLMGVAIKSDWKNVSIAFIIMAFFVATSLLGQNTAIILVRTATFLLAGGLAISFSRVRQRSKSALDSAQAIIRGTPIPMVAADITGAILAASDEIRVLLRDEFGPVIGHAFGDVFMGNLPPGKAMKLYLDWFQSQGIREEKLHLRDHSNAPISARILTIGNGRDRLLVAVLKDFPSL